MAATTSDNLKKFGDCFSNELFTAKLTYDFSVDGGEADDTVRIGQAASDVVITSAVVYVETACTSGGSATMIAGIEGGDVDAFLDATSGAVANLTANAVLFETTQQCYIASGSYVHVDIATADLTAGKVHILLTGRTV